MPYCENNQSLPVSTEENIMSLSLSCNNGKKKAPPISTFQTLPGRRSRPDEVNDDNNNNNEEEEEEEDAIEDYFLEAQFFDETLIMDDNKNGGDNNVERYHRRRPSFHDDETMHGNGRLRSDEYSKIRMVSNSTSTNRIRSIAIIVVVLVVVVAILFGILVPNSENNSNILSSQPSTQNNTEEGDVDNNEDRTDVYHHNIMTNTSNTTTIPPTTIFTAVQNNTNDEINNNNNNINNENTTSSSTINLTELARDWSGEKALQDSNSPASLALQWLLQEDPLFHQLDSQQPNVPPLLLMLDIQQRYVATVLSFAFRIPHDNVTDIDIDVDDDDDDNDTQYTTDLFRSGVDDVCLWNIPQDEDTSFKGIRCNDKGMIEGLYFQGLDVTGTLPMEIRLLTNLYDINFSINHDLTGSIPTEWSSLTELSILNLQNCSLTGTLPDTFSNLHQNLQSLLLSSNTLSGTIPSSWGELTSLTHLDLAFNKLSGNVPANLSKLPLSIARLNGNQFLSSIDEAFCLDASIPTLTANCLDTENGVLCSCCTICCDLNGLECTTPVDESQDGEMEAPEVVEDRVVALKNLLMPISGSALDDPSSEQSQVVLRMVNDDHPSSPLDENADGFLLIQKYILILLFDTLGGDGWVSKEGWLEKTDICDWEGINCENGNRVTEISLENKGCLGTLVSEIGALAPNLRTLRLSRNPQITERLPESLGMLTSLTTLDVSGCQFSGKLPSEIGRLFSLVQLNVENNALSGSIPSEMANMSSLQMISLGWNSFSGELPTEIGDLHSLVQLSFNDCQLSGTIPQQVSSLASLERLNLSGNTLFGSIPPDLGNMPQLERLYLNGNTGITGTVPEELAFSNLKEVYFHGTSIVGNLDLLFCTGEVERVTANCLTPEVRCTCCSICCDVTGEKCEQT